MRTLWRVLHRAGLTVVLAVAASPAARACAACFGRSDSPLAEGMNMGILFLLGVIVSVLVGFASFFVFLARRSARLHAAAPRPDTAPAHPA